MKNKTNKKGFTLVELIVYIAIAATTLVVAVNIGINLIRSADKAQGAQETYANARLGMHQIQLNMREAEDVITGSSTFGSHPGVLTLDFPGSGTDVVIDTYTQIVTIGTQTPTIRTLRIKEGTAAAIDLTDKHTDVTNFTLTNLTRGSENKNIHFAVTFSRANPGGDPNYNASISLETALSTRE